MIFTKMIIYLQDSIVADKVHWSKKFKSFMYDSNHTKNPTRFHLQTPQNEAEPDGYRNRSYIKKCYLITDTVSTWLKTESSGQLIKDSAKCDSDWSQMDHDFKGFSRGFDDTAVGHGQSWAHAVNSLPFARRLPRPTALHQISTTFPTSHRVAFWNSDSSSQWNW